MRLEISYTEAHRLSPERVREIVAAIRASRGKDRMMEPVLMRWRVEWGRYVGRRDEEATRGLVKHGERYLHVVLTASAGRVRRSAPLSFVPPQIADYYAMVDRQAKRQNRLRIVR